MTPTSPPHERTETTAVSAPGKVLLAGGYLVLDRRYTGLVFGLDARIHVGVHHLPTPAGVSLSEIIVRSPQFRDAEWRYGYRLAEADGGIAVTQLKGSSTAALSRNVFVETALSYALTYVSTRLSPHLEPADITILADDDYYSQPATSAARTGRFANFHVPLHQAHKTGLGSSAALVTAFVAAVLSHYLPSSIFSLSSDDARLQVHNLAQAAHCAAQGKVGSGFDVAAAVYGSCIYRRFSPSVLEGIGDVGSKAFGHRLRDLVEDTGSRKTWDTQISPDAVTIPPGVRLVMCDVDCGSQTVGMVKQVLQWRAQHQQDADLLWDRLHDQNEALAKVLATLVESQRTDEEDFQKCLNDIAHGADPSKTKLTLDLRDAITNIRASIRDMSTQSGVSIEPPPQTELLSSCSDLPGVIGGVVPGAGGHDAVALLVVDDERVLTRLQEHLASWRVSSGSDAEAASTRGRVRILGVRQEMEGVRREGGDLYSPWLWL